MAIRKIHVVPLSIRRNLISPLINESLSKHEYLQEYLLANTQNIHDNTNNMYTIRLPLLGGIRQIFL